MALLEGEGGARWYENLLVLLVLLFVVLGPLALPLVWRHPRLSRGMKVALTILTLAYTVVLVVATLRAARRLIGDAALLG